MYNNKTWSARFPCCVNGCSNRGIRRGYYCPEHAIQYSRSNWSEQKKTGNGQPQTQNPSARTHAIQNRTWNPRSIPDDKETPNSASPPSTLRTSSSSTFTPMRRSSPASTKRHNSGNGKKRNGVRITSPSRAASSRVAATMLAWKREDKREEPHHIRRTSGSIGGSEKEDEMKSPVVVRTRNTIKPPRSESEEVEEEVDEEEEEEEEEEESGNKMKGTPSRRPRIRVGVSRTYHPRSLSNTSFEIERDSGVSESISNDSISGLTSSSSLISFKGPRRHPKSSQRLQPGSYDMKELQTLEEQAVRAEAMYLQAMNRLNRKRESLGLSLQHTITRNPFDSVDSFIPESSPAIDIRDVPQSISSHSYVQRAWNSSESLFSILNGGTEAVSGNPVSRSNTSTSMLSMNGGNMVNSNGNGDVYGPGSPPPVPHRTPSTSSITSPSFPSKSPKNDRRHINGVNGVSGGDTGEEEGDGESESENGRRVPPRSESYIIQMNRHDVIEAKARNQVLSDQSLLKKWTNYASFGTKKLIIAISHTLEQVIGADKVLPYRVVYTLKYPHLQAIGTGHEFLSPLESKKTGLVGESLSTRSLLLLSHPSKHQSYHRGSHTSMGYIGSRTPLHAIYLPLLDGNGVPVGAIEFLRFTDRPFTSSDTEVLVACDHALSTCLTTALMYDTLKRLTRKAMALVEVADLLKQSDLGFNVVLRQIMILFEKKIGADRCTLFLVDETRGELWSSVSSGLKNEIRFSLSKGIAGYVARTGEAVNIEDAYADPRFNSSFDRKTGYKTKAVLCMPIHNSHGRVVGVAMMINSTRSLGVFDEDDIELLEMCCKHIGISMYTHELFEATRRFQRQSEIMHDVSHALSFEMETRPLFRTIMDKLRELIDCDRCNVFVADYEAKELWSMLFQSNEDMVTKKKQTEKKGKHHTPSLSLSSTHLPSSTSPSSTSTTTTAASSTLLSPSPSSLLRRESAPVQGPSSIRSQQEKHLNVTTSSSTDSKSRPRTLSLMKPNSTSRISASSSSTSSRSATSSIIGDSSQKFRIPMGKGIAGYVVTTGNLVNVRDAYEDDRFNSAVDKKTGYRTRTILCVPIRGPHGNKVIGCVQMINKKKGVFDNDDESIVTAFAAHIGITLQNISIYDEAVEAQERHYSLLRRMLPAHIVDKLHTGETYIAEPHERLFVLFSDIVNFTAMAAKITPQELVVLLNRIFGIFDTLTDRFNVYKVETIGDAYMVVAGLPFTKNPYPGIAICEMAKAMQKSLCDVNDPTTNKPVQIRVGIHYGPAVAGTVGEKMPRFCFFGDTVNTASRMESTGVPGHIQISSSVYEEVKEWYQVEERGSVKVKGKGEMCTYFLADHQPTFDVERYHFREGDEEEEEEREEEVEEEKKEKEKKKKKKKEEGVTVSISLSHEVSSNSIIIDGDTKREKENEREREREREMERERENGLKVDTKYGIGSTSHSIPILSPKVLESHLRTTSTGDLSLSYLYSSANVEKEKIEGGGDEEEGEDEEAKGEDGREREINKEEEEEEEEEEEGRERERERESDRDSTISEYSLSYSDISTDDDIERKERARERERGSQPSLIFRSQSTGSVMEPPDLE